MEFNVLPHARILSPKSNNKSNQTTTQTINVILPQNAKDTDEDKDKELPEAIKHMFS